MNFALLVPMSVWLSVAGAQPVALNQLAQTPQIPDLEAFPKVTTLQLQDCGRCDRGAVMVRIPPALRSIADPADGSDLLLLDAQGSPVPFAVARGEAAYNRLPLQTRSQSPNVFTVQSPSLAIDGLDVGLSGAAAVARVTVHELDTGRQLVKPTMLWTHEIGSQRSVHFAPTRARLRVELEWFGRAPKRRPVLIGLQKVPPSLQADRLNAPVVHRRVSEDGFVDYTVQMDHPMPINAVDLAAADAAVISRRVTVHTPAGPGQAHRELGDGQIRRVRIGDATLDATRVQLLKPPPADRFVIRVASEGQAALELPEVALELEGASIWFQPTGPGPYTLLGGAPAQTRPPSELQLALSELVRLPTTRVQIGAVEPHGAYQHPVLRSGLAEPGRPLPSPTDFRWTAPVDGATGMVRIPLSPAVQTAAGPGGLSGLRLTDTSDTMLQIPFLLRRAAVHTTSTVDMDSVERVEDGGISRLVVPIDSAQLALGTITLSTPAAAFRRQITVLRAAGKQLLPLRSVSWNGADRPGHLGIAIDEVIGDHLIIEIDNGDDPPLPVDGLELTRPGWELVAVLPDAGAVLHGGDPRRSEADFDLQLYQDSLTEAAVEEATVGPLVEHAPAPLALIDRASLLAGLAMLVAGLAALTVRLVRVVPAPAPDTGEDGSQEETPSA